MNTALYEIAASIQDILACEEWTEEAEAKLEGLSMALEHKVGNIVAFSHNLESFVETCKAEEKRIAERRKAAENRVKSLKDYLLRSMLAAERTTIEIGTKKISVQDNPPSVSVLEEAIIPARFFVTIPEQHQLDKKAVAEAIKKGEEVPGAVLTRGKSLRVR